MARLEKEVNKVAKGTSGKKTRKTGGGKKSTTSIEKSAKRLLK